MNGTRTDPRPPRGLRAGLAAGLLLVSATACALLPAPTPVVQECPAAMLSGVLERDGEALVVASEAGRQPVRWPDGYGVEPGAVLRLRDGAGRVVAVEGDPIFIGGGFTAGDALFIACGYVSTEPP